MNSLIPPCWGGIRFLIVLAGAARGAREIHNLLWAGLTVTPHVRAPAMQAFQFDPAKSEADLQTLRFILNQP